MLTADNPKDQPDSQAEKDNDENETIFHVCLSKTRFKRQKGSQEVDFR